MSEGEREELRERVASGAATGEERDRLAVILARAIRERDDAELDAIEALIDELRVLASAGSDRTSCTDALAGALLDAQIRAFERGEAADAWRRLDEIRARLHSGGTPDLLQDRLAAALYNMIRGGELLGDLAMRLAALEELRTRSYRDPSAAACRVALAELLADELARAARTDDPERAGRAVAELEGLHEFDPGVAIAREYARGLREMIAAEFSRPAALLDRLRTLAASFELPSGDPIRVRLAEGLVMAHASALRTDEELLAESLREQLRELCTSARGDVAVNTRAGLRGARARAAIIRAFGQALHDAAVLGLGFEFDGLDSQVGSTTTRAARALSELRLLVDHHETDAELRGQLMSALFQVHRNTIERDDDEAAELLQAEADALLTRDDALQSTDDADPEGRARLLDAPEHATRGRAQRAHRVRAQLRLDHLRMLLATHARAGDRGDWVRAELLLTRARNLVDLADSPLEMVEVLGQMLVNAHVDTGAANDEHSDQRDQHQRARALLLELRELAKAHPHSGALQLHLATALFNAHVNAGRRRASAQADRLLDDLERLHRDHPGLLELRRRLVMAIVNHHGDTLEREDLARASELLDRIRALVGTEDADNHLRMQLAMALGNNLAHVEDPANDEQGQRIINEMRVLAAREDAPDALRTLVLDELSDLFAPRQ
ncbi:hypothetical protein ENSA5_66000 [Enhygromyxa salina]|uniref:Uncharacterized protein n=1 Tax=Enhygromyxa salina TaxID=215803 RepID=A0A2S9XBR4_9BACT|nr:hypothetical protein [Enhygromyxa salina]PRP90304.1 hypothetical protein ENSA5_66000 [Enhygromyxa salina]